MRGSIGLTLLTASSLIASVTADVMNLRSFPSCVYVDSQIYCFGGYVDKTLDANMYSLDISQYQGNTTSLMYSKWNVVTYNSPFDMERDRIQPAVIAAGGGKQLLVQGGYNSLATTLVNHTILYDTTTKTWQTLAPYSGSDKIVRQIYLGTAVDMGNNNVGFFGGIEQHGDGMTPRTVGGVSLPLFNSTRVNIGYIPLQIFNTQTKVWSEYSPQINAPYAVFPNSQSAVINPATGKIYYFGGSYYTPSSLYSNVRFPFSQALVFDSKTSSWSTPSFSGDVPSNRIYQTVTLLSNSDILILFGGSDDGGNKAATSYCFSLNLTTSTWKNEVDSIGVPSDKSGPRFGHSALLANSTLFILFGMGLSGSLVENAILTIDVSNPSNVKYTDVYMPNTIASPPPNGTNNNSSDTGSQTRPEGLSKGAIGGIAAGSAVGGLLIIALVGFCIWRKKNSKSNKSVEDMQIDWDKIEDHFMEVPAPNAAAIIPDSQPQQQQSNILHSVNDDATATTLTNSPHLANETVISSSDGSVGEIRQHALREHVTKVVKPSAAISPTIGPKIADITKPDAV